MAETVRIYINARGIDVPATATALDAVEAWDPAQADAIKKGERMITDSRGLPATPETPVHGGAIYRVVRNRSTTTDTDETETL